MKDKNRRTVSRLRAAFIAASLAASFVVYGAVPYVSENNAGGLISVLQEGDMAALRRAASNGNLATVAFLLERGVNIHVDNNDMAQPSPG